MAETQKQRWRTSIEGPDIRQDLLGDPILSETSHRPILGDNDRERFTPKRTGLIGTVL